MHSLPDFARRLGIGLDADERTIKRHYSRELKQIDQDANPVAFQELREAYEAALFWLRAGGYRDLDEEPAPAGAVDEAVPDDAQLPGQVEHDATVVLSAFQQRFASIDAAANPMKACCEALQASLDDARLVHIDARMAFELSIAQLLADGWRPGHQYLFIAALRVLNWTEDRSRLQMFGHAGYLLESAIEQRALFGMQSLDDCALQSDLIERLRDPAPPAESELARLMPADVLLARHFPSWAAIITDVGNLETWRDRDRKLPLWRRLTLGDKATLVLGAVVFVYYAADRYHAVRQLLFAQ